LTLLYLTLAWIGGILLSYLLWSRGIIGCDTPGWPFGVLGGAALVIAVGLRQQRKARLVSLLAVTLLLGGWRYQAHPSVPCLAPADLAFYNDQDAESDLAVVEGAIVGYPEVRDVRTSYRLRAEQLTIRGMTRPTRGDVLVQVARLPAYRYGDQLRVIGHLQTPPVFDDMDYRAYLARQGIYSLVRQARVELVARDQGSRFWAWLYGLRARGSTFLDRVLPEPAAALANGMLLGIESGIAPEVEQAFQDTGASHVIVISGSNVALLAGLLLAVVTPFLGRRRAGLFVVPCIVVYVLLVGADAPAMRAGLMGILYVIAIALGRQSTAWVSLIAAVLLMTIVNPLALWDVGFQLSFAATLGLILFTPGITTGFDRLFAFRVSRDQLPKAVRILSDALIVTLAAQIALLPLLVYYFGRLSPISLATNLLILPAQPPILVGGMATLATGLIWEPLGRILAAVPWLFLTYTTAVVRLSAAMPFASLETGRPDLPLLLLYYAVLLGIIGLRRARLRLTPSEKRAMAWSLAAVVPVWLWLSGLGMLGDGRLHLTFLPGDDGEAVLLTTPAGRHAWVWDGNGDGGQLAQATRRTAIVSQPNIDVAFMPGPEPGADSSSDVLWPGAQMIDPGQLSSGTVVRMDHGVTLTRLNGGPDWALLLTYGGFRAILPVTLEPEVQAALLETDSDLRATVLKAPGPGTGVWPTTAFVLTAAPQLILWPEGTTYPPDVSATLAGYSTTRVPSDARLEIVTDGKRLWLRQWSGIARR
jgi:competence protein ComEC